MSEYTTADIKDSFVCGDIVGGDGVEWECLREDAEAIFEAWHAAEIRRAKAEALREAAGLLIESARELSFEHPTDLSYINCTRMDASELRKLAADIEATL